MAVNSREELKEYALRALGAPVLEINVDDAQLEDRIDDALEYWVLYFYDGIEQVYLKERVTASKIAIAETNGLEFEELEQVKGQTSGAYAFITKEANVVTTASNLVVWKVNGEFEVGETIVGGITGTSATVESITLGNYDKKYIEVPDIVYAISRIIPIAMGHGSQDIFDLQYQLRLHDLYDLSSTSIIYYKQVMQHLDLIDHELNTKPTFRFNRITNQLHLDIDWNNDVQLGMYIVIDAYRALDPSKFSRVWNDLWLKQYVTAQFKKAWATNLKKFSGMQLPGGVTIDGDKLYDEAMTEIKDLEQEFKDTQSPLGFSMG